MWAAGNNFLYLIHIKQLNVGKRLHLEQHLVSGTSCQVAAVRFFCAQHRIIDF